LFGNVMSVRLVEIHVPTTYPHHLDLCLWGSSTVSLLTLSYFHLYSLSTHVYRFCLPDGWPLPHLVSNFLARFMGHTFQFTLLTCFMMLCWNTSTYSLSTCVVFLRGHFPINPCFIPHRALSPLLSLGFDGFREFHNGFLFPAEAIESKDTNTADPPNKSFYVLRPTVR